jgi:DNA helicase-2/ATP-dependent DNA helicase PcrA
MLVLTPLSSIFRYCCNQTSEIMGWEPTPEQREAINCPPTDHCIVRAGPGSGKTFFLVQRVLNILRSVENSRVVCFSFTNESARELKRRLAGFGVVGSRVQASTIHKFCLNGFGQRLKVVKNKPVLLHVLRKVITSDHRAALIGDNENLSPSSLIEEAEEDDNDDSDTDDSAVHNKENTDQTLLPESEQKFLTLVLEAVRKYMRDQHDQISPFPAAIRQIASLYVAELLKDNTIDLSVIVSEFLKRFDNLLPYIQSVGTYLFVDEFQDLDPEQVLLVQKLIDTGKILTAVGDVNQSIYGWRQDGKRVRIYTPSHSQYQMFCFSLNMRCADAIVRVSNQLVDSRNVSARCGGSVQLLVCRNEMEELLRVACIVKSFLQKSTFETSPSISVLFRLNSDKERFAKILDQQRIPFHGKHSSQSRRFSKALDQFLAVADAAISNEQEALVHSMYLSLAPKKADEVRSYLASFQDVISLNEAVTRKESANFACKSMISEFLAKMSKVNKQNTVSAQVEAILSVFKISRKTKDLGKLLDSVVEADTLADLVRLFRARELDETNRRNAANGVYVGTIHSAKGREWQTVLIPLVNENNFRYNNRDEEKRVLYVALTRAMDKVILTCSKPSVFLSALSVTSSSNVNTIIQQH